METVDERVKRLSALGRTAPKTAKDYLTTAHGFFSAVDDKTRVYLVGVGMAKMSHVCEGDPTRRLHTNAMDKPTHVAKSAAFCNKCNKLWVAEEPASG